MGRSPCCAKEGLNRGPWSAKEDALLSNYILLHGEGQWRSLPNKAGLLRCGKSCRLRWMNYLRPGIKRGNISQDEEDLIVRLHGLLGNRWSLIAGRLPGRTDNEIKNYWNTHLLKKLTTAGLLPTPNPNPNPKPKPITAADKKKKKLPKKAADPPAAAAATADGKKKIQPLEEKLDPPKTKVYLPKPMRISPGFSRSSSYDSSASGASSSEGVDKVAVAAEVASYVWPPLFEGGGEGEDEDDFLVAGEFLPLLQHQLDAMAGDAGMLDQVYDEYLQLL